LLAFSGTEVDRTTLQDPRVVPPIKERYRSAYGLWSVNPQIVTKDPALLARIPDDSTRVARNPYHAQLLS